MSALDGVRVLDVSQGAAGPTAGAILGDHGATVIKLEPRDGEWGRTLGPPFWHGTATAAIAMNRNKRSLAVDLRRPEGLAVARRLAADADVVLESFRPGVMDRLGLGYETLRETTPRLVYCAISAFGPSGPRRDQPGVDGIVQALSGLMSITGTEDGEPVKVGVPAADMTAAFQAVQGVLLALLARERTGRGQRVDVSLLDSLLAFQLVPLTMYGQTREVPRRTGSGAAYSTPNEAYRTRDGEIMVAAYTPARWRALCNAIECPGLLDDPRFATNSDRMAHRAALRDELERRFRERPTRVWTAILSEADVMCAPVVDYAELTRDPQVAENDMLVDLEHPLGTVSSIGVPLKLSGTPGRVRGAGPLIGEHTREILRESGHADDEIERLLAEGVVGPAASGATDPASSDVPKGATT